MSEMANIDPPRPPVTVRAKRYTGPWVFVCVGCGCLDTAERRDKVTCSGACRVRAKRNGSLEVLRNVCRAVALEDENTGKPDVATIAQYDAVQRLRPDLCDQLDTNSITLAQAQRLAYREFIRMIVEAAKSEMAREVSDE